MNSKQLFVIVCCPSQLGLGVKGLITPKGRVPMGRPSFPFAHWEEAMYLQASEKDSSVLQEGEHMKAPSSPSLTKLGVGSSGS